MKFSILLSIFFALLTKRQLTARDIADEHSISHRTVYRYVELLAEHIPLTIKRGRNGGIFLADNYKLPLGYTTEEEYEAIVQALTLAYSQMPEEKFLLAKRKMSARCKEEKRTLTLSGDIGCFFTDGSSFGDIYACHEKARIFSEAIKKRSLLDLGYQTAYGEKIKDKIEPHALAFRQGVWYGFAFSHENRCFRVFRLGGIFALTTTETTFRKRPFSYEDIPFDNKEAPSVAVRLQIEKSAYLAAQNWLGAEVLKKKGSVWLADLLLPDHEGLAAKILSLGKGVTVLQPQTLRDQVSQIALDVAKNYS